ncbi:MAG: hypothetical protein ACYDHH_33010 [Solirubrobacteraceae bacterium]
MGKKVRAAKASLVAAFLAAGGAATAKAVTAGAAPANTGGRAAASANWGDPLIRFLKLDGFPAYLKLEGFAQLAQYYKEQLLTDTATLYDKWRPQVDDLLALYQKADAGPLTGILVGLETFYKEQNIQPLLDYLKTPGAMDAYLKFEGFFSALRAVAAKEGPSAFQFFYKETGIVGNPVGELTDGGVIG